ncbi:MAG: hypothetical protein ACXABN_18190 [Candidatus Thorarchaeota archaeon]|jgi:hypothetical protein
MKIQFEKVPRMPPREKWYRIEEREKTSTNIKLPWNEGSFVEYERYIVRAGYEWQPKDMPIELLQQRATDHIRNKANKIIGRPALIKMMRTGVVDYEFQSRGHHHKPFDGPITDEIVDAVLHAADSTPEYMLKHLFYTLRGEWVREQKEQYPRLRTFWYIDIEDTWDASQIREPKVKCIGTKEHGYTSYYDPEGYEPDYFHQWSRHLLYPIGWHNSVLQDERVYVHPLDVKHKEA